MKIILIIIIVIVGGIYMYGDQISDYILYKKHEQIIKQPIIVEPGVPPLTDEPVKTSEPEDTGEHISRRRRSIFDAITNKNISYDNKTYDEKIKYFNQQNTIYTGHNMTQEQHDVVSLEINKNTPLSIILPKLRNTKEATLFSTAKKILNRNPTISEMNTWYGMTKANVPYPMIINFIHIASRH